MITDICIVFGCGKQLTAIEKLCGNKCIDHQNEIKTVNKMTKQEIIDKLNQNISLLVEASEGQVKKANDYLSPPNTSARNLAAQLSAAFAEHMTAQAAALRDILNDVKKLRTNDEA